MIVIIDRVIVAMNVVTAIITMSSSSTAVFSDCTDPVREPWILMAMTAGSSQIKPHIGGRNSSLVVFGLAVHSVAGSILLWGSFPVEGIFPLELTWVQTPFPQKLFRMRV